MHCAHRSLAPTLTRQACRSSSDLHSNAAVARDRCRRHSLAISTTRFPHVAGNLSPFALTPGGQQPSVDGRGIGNKCRQLRSSRCPYPSCVQPAIAQLRRAASMPLHSHVSPSSTTPLRTSSSLRSGCWCNAQGSSRLHCDSVIAWHTSQVQLSALRRSRNQAPSALGMRAGAPDRRSHCFDHAIAAAGHAALHARWHRSRAAVDGSDGRIGFETTRRALGSVQPRRVQFPCGARGGHGPLSIGDCGSHFSRRSAASHTGHACSAVLPARALDARGLYRGPRRRLPRSHE